MTRHPDYDELTGLLQKSPLTRRTVLVTGLSAGFAAAVQPVTADTLTTNSTGLEAGEVKIPDRRWRDAGATARCRPPAGPSPWCWWCRRSSACTSTSRTSAGASPSSATCAIAPELYARQGDVSKYTDYPRDHLERRVEGARRTSDVGPRRRGPLGQDARQGDATQLGVTGFCWGGRIVWLYSAHNPDPEGGRCLVRSAGRQHDELQPSYPIDVAVDPEGAGARPLRRQGRWHPNGRRRADAGGAEAAAKSPSKIVLFPDAPHGFHADYRPSYRPEAARDAWQQCLAWFREHGVA